MVTRLIVARHAETECARAAVLNGDPRRPCPLTARGREQAAAMGTRLAGVEIDLCLVTEFARTRSTAEVVLTGRDVPIEVEPMLNDPPLGDLEGLPLHAHSAWMEGHDWSESPGPGGESQLDAIRRYVAGWVRVLERSQPCVLVVAHAFTISFALTLASGETPAVRRRYEVEVHLAQMNEVDAVELSRGLARAAAELSDLGERPAPLDAGPERGR